MLISGNSFASCHWSKSVLISPIFFKKIGRSSGAEDGLSSFSSPINSARRSTEVVGLFSADEPMAGRLLSLLIASSLSPSETCSGGEVASETWPFFLFPFSSNDVSSSPSCEDSDEASSSSLAFCSFFVPIFGGLFWRGMSCVPLEEGAFLIGGG